MLLDRPRAAVDNRAVIRPRAATVVASLALLLLAAAGATGCGGNACQDAEERLAECLGADDTGDEEEIPDEDCTEDVEAQAECIVDSTCEDINSGLAFENCTPDA
jgi:hypothetical protein